MSFLSSKTQKSAVLCSLLKCLIVGQDPLIVLIRTITIFRQCLSQKRGFLFLEKF